MSRVSFGSRAGDVSVHGGGVAFVSPRHARVPEALDSLEALTDALADELRAAAESPLPVCTTVELSLTLNAVLPLVRPTIGPYAEGGEHDLPLEFKNGRHGLDGDDNDSGHKHPRAACSVIVNVEDPKAKQIVQRAASRGLIAAIQALDGFRYSFNNAWTAKEEEGSRFSFICQDSMQNKDRHANGYTRILKHLKDPAGPERGVRKPTYDCKGSVSVKFSASRQSCEVYYRHNAIHATVSARKPVPRTTSGAAKRTSSSWLTLSNAASADFVPQDEEDGGGLSAMLQAESAKPTSRVDRSSPAARPQPTISNISRPLKRKREDMIRNSPLQRHSDQPLSLADLLRQSETAKVPPPPGDNGDTNFALGAAAVAYELPSWQTPPPPLNRSIYELSYQLPYQPLAQKRSLAAFNPIGPSTPMIPRNPPIPAKNLQQSRSVSAQKPSTGLFTTMKMNAKPALRWSQPSYQTLPDGTQFLTNGKPRSMLACTNCRLAKKRCDEGRPVCGACSQTSRADCRYEPPAHWQKQAASDAPHQPQQNDITAPEQANTIGSHSSSETAQQADTSVQRPQALTSSSQSVPPSAQQSLQTWTSARQSQQQPSPTAFDADTSMQQPSLSAWSQDSTSISSWPEMPSQSTNTHQWPSRNASPLPTWADLSSASSTPAKRLSPDSWYPKRS